MELPKRLSKMTHPELLHECQARNIPLESSSIARPPNRAQMIMAIKSWVETMSGQQQPDVDDWYMGDTPGRSSQ